MCRNPTQENNKNSAERVAFSAVCLLCGNRSSFRLGGGRSLFLFPGEDVAQIVNDGVVNRGKQQGDNGGDDHAGDHGNARFKS